MKSLLMILALLIVSGCTGPIDGKARLGPGDFADVGSTAIALSAGFVEANPLVAGAGDAVPLVGLVLKYAAKWMLIEIGVDPTIANKTVETAGMAAACWNISIITSGTNPASALAALVCGTIYYTQIERFEGNE